MLQPIHKTTMLKQVRTHGKWEGYIAPSNVNAANVKGYWNLGMSITVERRTTVEGTIYYVVGGEVVSTLNSFIHEFVYYNCNPQLGKTVRFWEETN